MHCNYNGTGEYTESKIKEVSESGTYPKAEQQGLSAADAGYTFFAEEEKILERLVNEHWCYINALLDAHNESEEIRDKISFHYRSAFIHGWKHHKEYMQTKNV